MVPCLAPRHQRTCLTIPTVSCRSQVLQKAAPTTQRRSLTQAVLDFSESQQAIHPRRVLVVLLTWGSPGTRLSQEPKSLLSRVSDRAPRLSLFPPLIVSVSIRRVLTSSICSFILSQCYPTLHYNICSHTFPSRSSLYYITRLQLTLLLPNYTNPNNSCRGHENRVLTNLA